ncbi:MAG TPA: PAS domain S-box protein, partial [Thermodesulfobacteriota bacterium]|nr:PAS domain S-box protein [Thermodesulfobacteriota bacterium]
MSDFEEPKEKSSESPHPQPKVINVLLIEDNPGDARLVKEMLVDAGQNRFSLAHVALIRDGLSLLRRGPGFHLILLDLSLPDGQGLDAIRQVCAAAPYSPVVILTGLDDETVAVRAVQEGAEDYLVKGRMDSNLLARAIRYAIERKHAEERLRESEEKYRTILENIEDGYYEVDLAGNLTFFNDSMCRIWGYPKEELMGMNNRQYTDRENAKRLFQAFNHVYRTGEPRRECDWGIIRKDGTTRYLEASVSLRNDASGKPMGFRGIVRDITERKRAEEALKESEKGLRIIFESIQAAVLIIDPETHQIVDLNPAALKLIGAPKEKIVDAVCHKFVCPAEIDKCPISDLNQNIENAERSLLTANGEARQIIKTVVPILLGGRRYLLESFVDITERKRAEEALRESEERFRQLAENIREVFYIHEEGIPRYVSPAYAEIWGRPPQTLCEDPNSFLETIHPEDREDVKAFMEKKNHEEYEVVYRIVRPDASIRWIRDHSFPIEDGCGRMGRVVGIAADITDLKLGEEKLRYLSLHDPLTGLYNRIYFEEEMSRIEKARHETVGILSCDVDGLKLVNDTLGHDQGDRLLAAAARVIRDSFREGDLAARIGGDEFAVVLPNTTPSAVENACQRIQEGVDTYNATTPELPLSISVGFAVRNGSHKNLKDVFKEADNHMYRKKLYRTQSVRSTLVNTLINTLKARDLATERHASRLEKLLVRMAALIGLSESTTADLSLLAKFHDIGKVGISDAILHKEGPFTPEEWTEMKRHCEIGYRIALSAPDLVPIADWILKHHEWWDGQGYPLGIQGEEIPVECRLLAIADAYDALISARPYRRTFSHREAVAELR